MIITFEDHTFEITPYEHDIVMPAIVEYIQRAGDDIIFNNQEIIEALKNVYGINSITESELVRGSGEVLYIQNIRPIDRQQKQREEFRISIGF